MDLVTGMEGKEMCEIQIIIQEKDFVTKMMDVNIIKMAGIIVLHTPKVHQNSVMFIRV